MKNRVLSLVLAAFAATVFLSVCFSPARVGAATVVLSSPTASPPSIDGAVPVGEWDSAGQLALTHGDIYAQHDAGHLYLLLDVTADTHQDTGIPPDFFWLTFDVDQDAAITPNVDLNYGRAGQPTFFGKQYYLGPGMWTGSGATTSQVGYGFGPSSVGSATDHTIWEFAIDRTEIGWESQSQVWIGLKVSSQTPSFTENVPLAFSTDFSNLIEVRAVPEPSTLILLTTAALALTIGWWRRRRAA